MKLFDKFEAVWFPEENMIFITNDRFLYYIYDVERKRWRKHRNAGNDMISVTNYPSVTRVEIATAMGGVFPSKETEFMRLSDSSQLWIRDLMDLLMEDYPRYLSNWDIRRTIHMILLESDICYYSYEKIRTILDSSLQKHVKEEQVNKDLKDLSLTIMGRDIFKKEIGIVDGHDGSSYFWIMPVRVFADSDPDNFDSIAEMRVSEISIEEDDVGSFLTPFLYKYFDNELHANKMRDVDGFEWYLTHNFYTYESVEKIIEDIKDTVDALSTGRENEYIDKLRETKGLNTEISLIIDFYHRFIYRMEYMITVGKENGYNFISFMGP